jgi:DNA invertase Pin-like site-specific DNA recombinase
MTSHEPNAADRPAKIMSHHLDRWAVVYVRQSEPQQVQRHPESALVQADLRRLALGWGWPPARIRVLDGDQGRSGTSIVGRDDFAWLIGEVILGHVGLVLVFQINRLAREDEACARLIRVCRDSDTLLADQDGVYHPMDFNDRLVLSIKGLMGGFELHLIQQRMQTGRLNRARRGEWIGQVPPGYVIGPDRKLELEPDEQARDTIRSIFDLFDSTGSLSGLLRRMMKEHIDMPCRVLTGRLEWHRPHRETLRQLLRRPAYAGAYTWGRRPVDPRRQQPGRRGTGRVERPPQDCAVFLPDNHAAYITWERYEANVRQLSQQRRHGPVPGPARRTVAVLAGLVVCGECGCRMQTRYTKALRYDCQRRALDYGGPACRSVAGEPLERLVAEQILEVVTPAGLEVCLRAVAECEREREAEEHRWRLRLERAAQEEARAARQYDAVEPENRLVARMLERKWEEAMLARRSLEEDYARYRRDRPDRLTAGERSEIEALSRDLPAIWHSPGGDLEEKRRVARLLLQRVVVWAPLSTAKVKVHLHWSFGSVTEHIITRSVSSWGQVAGVGEVIDLIAARREAGWSSGRIAEELNTAGQRTPHQKLFTSESVRKLLSRGTGAGRGDEPGPSRSRRG